MAKRFYYTDIEISPRIRELIESGTPTKKALTIVMDWTDRKNTHKPTLISADEKKALENSFTKRDAQILYYYASFYSVYVRFSTRLALAQSIFEKNANEIIGDYNMIHAEELVLTDFFKYLRNVKDPNNDPEMELIFKGHGKYKTTLAFVNNEVNVYYNNDRADWWKIIQEKVEHLKDDYKNYKEIVVGVEAFIEKKKKTLAADEIDPKLALPPAVKAILADVKKDYVSKRAPALSKKELQKKIKRGEQVSDIERERAIFPCYEDIETTEKGVKFWENLLDMYLDDMAVLLYERTRK